VGRWALGAIGSLGEYGMGRRAINAIVISARAEC